MNCLLWWLITSLYAVLSFLLDRYALRVRRPDRRSPAVDAWVSGHRAGSAMAEVVEMERKNLQNALDEIETILNEAGIPVKIAGSPASVRRRVLWLATEYLRLETT